MAPLKAQANIMKDERGSAVMLLGFLFLFCFFVMSMVVLEFMILKTNMEKCNDAVAAAGLAGLGELDKEALSYNVVIFDREAAEAAFVSYLQDNVQDVCSTAPVIEEFTIYNREDLPAVCSCGKNIVEPSIHVVVRFAVKRPVLRGLLGEEYIFRIHLDCDDLLE